MRIETKIISIREVKVKFILSKNYFILERPFGNQNMTVSGYASNIIKIQQADNINFPLPPLRACFSGEDRDKNVRPTRFTPESFRGFILYYWFESNYSTRL